MALPYDSLLITCEHGSNRIPARYRYLFASDAAVLHTHRALDIGALAVAKILAKLVDAPLFHSTTSRLLIDLNRSLHHKGAYSEFTGRLAEAERTAICSRYYTPYRTNVEAWIRSQTLRKKRVLHLSIHSFTPQLNGDVRNAEIGLLYDPRRKAESYLAAQIHERIKPQAKAEGWRIRRNYPYHGASDGFTTHLRRLFAPSAYLGLEIEMNQHVVAAATGQKKMANLWVQSLPLRSNPKIT